MDLTLFIPEEFRDKTLKESEKQNAPPGCNKRDRIDDEVGPPSTTKKRKLTEGNFSNLLQAADDELMKNQ